MNISSGVSEIMFGSVSRPENKVYLWPKLTEQPVESVKGVSGRQQTGVVYHRATPQERDQIISDIEQQMTYSSQGMNRPRFSYAPGTLFDALA